MTKKWKLKVTKFAKIAYAEVELAPLICFVGDNNSGKSYLLSLLWGILTYGKELFPQKPSEAESYKKCNAWLMKHINESVLLDDEATAIYLAWYNDLLKTNRNRLVKKIFNHSVEIESLSISDYSRRNELKLQWNDSGKRYGATEKVITFPKHDQYTQEEYLTMNAYICWNLLMGGIAAPLYTPTVKGRRMGEPVYLPASRTGFMLTYPQLLDQSLQLGYALDDEKENAQTKLTMPYVDFLRLILKFDTSVEVKAKNQELIDFIEHKMTKGSLAVKKEYMPIIQYQPAKTGKTMPLYLASSVVSEISPLLLLFKSNIKFNTIIIEEPEAHLHPALQKEMAHFIIKLSNAGIPVWLTTHSETILQHINNMIKLGKNKNRDALLKTYGYENDACLNKENVRMYQFNRTEKGLTGLEALESNDYGFTVPTFNDAMEQLVNEVYAFQGEGSEWTTE